MCRLLAFWGKGPVDQKYWLLEAENSLLKQSRDDVSHRPNPDGWGFAYRDEKGISVIKNPKPAFSDPDFPAHSVNLRSDFLFAHIRRRSQGEVSIENTHPFVHGEWIFMHNGNIPNFPRVRDALQESLAIHEEIKTLGSTDSEFLFHYFLQAFEKRPVCNQYCALNIIYNIISEIIEFTVNEDPAMLALNFLLSNGEFIIGFRKNRTLFYSLHKDGIIIASEPIDQTLQWNEIPEEHFILCNEPGKVQLASCNLELKKDTLKIS